jgi:signal transduction histidine kinase
LRKESVDLGSLVGSAVESTTPLLDERHHEFSVDLADPSLRLEVDPTRISQVLSNLLDNAAKYTPARRRIVLAAHRDGSEVVISVADSGAGIAAGVDAAASSKCSRRSARVPRAVSESASRSCAA